MIDHDHPSTPIRPPAAWARDELLARQRQLAQQAMPVLLLIAGLIVGLLLTARGSRVSLRGASRSNGAIDISFQMALSMQEEQQELRRQLQDLRSQMNELQRISTGHEGQLAGLQQQLDAQKRDVGLTALQGPGLIVTLDDSTNDVQPNDPNLNRYVIHQQQLVSLLGVLWNSGAEAIAINNQRITDQTSVYCVGSTVVVNQALLSPPFRVLAIGQPAELEQAVRRAPQLTDMWNRRQSYGITVELAQQRALEIPGHNGRLATQHLRPQP